MGYKNEDKNRSLLFDKKALFHSLKNWFSDASNQPSIHIDQFSTAYMQWFLGFLLFLRSEKEKAKPINLDIIF